MNRRLLAVLALCAAPFAADAFCGFYVAQADASLFNEASRVVLVRDGDATTMTMVNDFRGPVEEFAIVVPVPTVITKESVEVGNMATVDHLDAFSAPRLTEYHDPDPCAPPRPSRADIEYKMASGAMREMAEEDVRGGSLGVKIEATYTVGEYDILILSANDSSGLETWLRREGYRIPAGASEVLGSYIRQNMRFFVAKVNLEEQKKTEQPTLRPLRVRYSSPKFMLPIRLGTVNAAGPQDLLVYAITPKGRVETTNYRTTKLPSGVAVPPFVKQDFGTFYKDMFQHEVDRRGMTTVFTEYAWPLTVWCDPCSADPLSTDQLRELGADWMADAGKGGGGYLTRMHVRYDRAHFPEDLVFQETADTQPWQAIYQLHNPFVGDTTCSAGRAYETELAARQVKEVASLADLTGWNPDHIWERIPVRKNGPARPSPTGSGFWDWR